MSVFSLNSPGFAVSTTSDDLEMKQRLLDCLEVDYEETDEVFDGIYGAPDSLEEISEMEFLESDHYLRPEKVLDLFLLLNKLFDKTTLIDADEWYYEEDDSDWDEDEDDDDEDDDEDDDDDWEDEDESGEVFGSKQLRVFDPNDFKKYKYDLSFHEVLDMGGGSNGADVDFDSDAEVKEEKIEGDKPSEGFVGEILEKAQEKGYSDLVDLIKEKTA